MKVNVLDVAQTVANAAMKTKTAAVILAAGSSTRMSGKNKQLEKLDGTPVLAHTLLAYQRCPMISQIVVVTRPQDFDAVKEIYKQYRITKMTHIACGGKTRQESAMRGVAKLDAAVGYVAIADGARCLITPEQITKVCLYAYRHEAASAAHLISDTVKRTNATGMTVENVDRKHLWAVQTPQVFHTSLYTAAMLRAETDGIEVTDDNSLIEHLGYQVHLVECGASNMKITTPDDLSLAEAILKARSQA